MAFIDFDDDGRNDLVELFEALFDKNNDGTVNSEDLEDFFVELLKGEDDKFTAEDLIRIFAKIQGYLALKK